MPPSNWDRDTSGLKPCLLIQLPGLEPHWRWTPSWPPLSSCDWNSVKWNVKPSSFAQGVLLEKEFPSLKEFELGFHGVLTLLRGMKCVPLRLETNVFFTTLIEKSSKIFYRHFHPFKVHFVFTCVQLLSAHLNAFLAVTPGARHCYLFIFSCRCPIDLFIRQIEVCDTLSFVELRNWLKSGNPICQFDSDNCQKL